MNVTVQTLGRVVLGGIALSITPAPVPPAPPVEFKDVWNDSVRAIEYNRVIRNIELTKPRVVSTERFLPQTYVEVLPPDDPPPLPQAVIKPKPIVDVCTKHRMRKVWYGKVWRCRR